MGREGGMTESYAEQRKRKFRSSFHPSEHADVVNRHVMIAFTHMMLMPKRWAMTLPNGRV